MLNLFVMHFLFLIALIINQFTGWDSVHQQLDLVRILAPGDADVLQGVVTIKGTIAGVGLQRSEVGFRYQDGGSESWFFIEQINEAIVDAIIAQWDTATIADGTYQLRIIAYYADGHQLETIVNNLRVRNYTAIETPIFSTEESVLPGLPIETPTSLPSKTAPIATPTLLAVNEMVLTTDDIAVSVVQGAVIGILFLLVLGLWVIIRRGRFSN
jgi:hypothetical protein